MTLKQEVRSYAHEDTEAVLQLHREAFAPVTREGYPSYQERFLGRLSPERTIVAEEDGKVIGFLSHQQIGEYWDIIRQMLDTFIVPGDNHILINTIRDLLVFSPYMQRHSDNGYFEWFFAPEPKLRWDQEPIVRWTTKGLAEGEIHAEIDHLRAEPIPVEIHHYSALQQERKFIMRDAVCLPPPGVPVNSVTVALHMRDNVHFAANIAVHPDYQQKGVGLLLAEAALEQVVEAGAAAIFAQLISGSPAEKIAERLGFKPILRWSPYYENGAGTLFMGYVVGGVP